ELTTSNANFRKCQKSESVNWKASTPRRSATAAAAAEPEPERRTVGLSAGWRPKNLERPMQDLPGELRLMRDRPKDKRMAWLSGRPLLDTGDRRRRRVTAEIFVQSVGIDRHGTRPSQRTSREPSAPPGRLAKNEAAQAEMPEIDRLSQSVGTWRPARQDELGKRESARLRRELATTSDRLQAKSEAANKLRELRTKSELELARAADQLQELQYRSNRQRQRRPSWRASSKAAARRKFNARSALLVRWPRNWRRPPTSARHRQRRNGGVVESPEPADEQRQLPTTGAASAGSRTGCTSWCGQTPDVNMAASPHNNGCSAAAGGAGGAAAEKAAQLSCEDEDAHLLEWKRIAELQQRNQRQPAQLRAARIRLRLRLLSVTPRSIVESTASSAVASRSTSTIATSALTSTLASTWSSTSAAVLSDRNRLSAGGIQQQQQQQQPPPPPQPSSSSAEPVVPAKKTLVYSIEMNRAGRDLADPQAVAAAAAAAAALRLYANW
uniref:Reverse transcriptase domain-containing protein n=1 Tax=Macrostomum lignano TaxID=282301 RepID=A0A1I8FG05_9PLAT